MTFVLNTDILDSGSNFAFEESILEGRGRSIVAQWDQAAFNQDLEILGYSVRFFPAEEQAENPRE